MYKLDLAYSNNLLDWDGNRAKAKLAADSEPTMMQLFP